MCNKFKIRITRKNPLVYLNIILFITDLFCECNPEQDNIKRSGVYFRNHRFRLFVVANTAALHQNNSLYTLIRIMTVSNTPTA